MRKSAFKEIMTPGNKWIVYLYVLPPHPPYFHVMFYVGISSKDIQTRWRNSYGTNPEFRRAVKAVGGVGNIGIYILDIVDDGATAGQLESYYVNEVYHSLYDPDHPETCYGYNKQTGGLTGFTLCEYSRRLISKATSVPVAQIEPCADKLCAVYSSMMVAEKITEISHKQISFAVCGQHLSAGGYRWADLTLYLTPYQIEKIFYSKDTVGLLTQLDLKALYESLPPKKEKKTAAAGDNPAVLSLPEGGDSIDKAK